MAQPADPLSNPAFRPPGLLERLRETFMGDARPIDCVQIETTSVCGAACIYCPHTTSASWKSRHMSAEIFASLWPLLRKAGRAHLQGWGEPLLNPDFFRFQELASRAGCQTSTTSCGMIMNDEIAEKLADSGMDLIAFSLAGTDENSNSVRRRAPFAKVCESIRILRGAIDARKKQPALEIHLAYIMLADRMEAIAGLPELMDRLNVELAVISTLDYLALPDHRDLAFHPQDKDKIAKARAILEAVSRDAEKSGRIIHYSLPGEKPIEAGCRENIGKSLYVDADGRISPCIYLNVPDEHAERKVFGDSLEKSALEVWKQDDFRDFRKSLLASKPDKVCLKCPKRFER